MARAFIHQGVWRIQPSLAFDAPVQQRATLRVSAVAAAVTLALAALGDGGPAPRASVPERMAVIIALPELASVKAQDRVPSASDTLSPLRRRAPLAETSNVLDSPQVLAASPESTAIPRTPLPAREAEAVDGGFIRSGDEMFRLAGIVPAEQGRSCRRLDGLAVACADRAQSYLQLLIKGRAVVCERTAQRGDGPAEANCRVGDADIAEQMVRQGWARAGDRPEERFMVAEASARRQQLGLWRD